MSLYHLGSLMTFAYLAFFIVTVIASRFVFASLFEGIIRDTSGWKEDIGLFLASLMWITFIAGMAYNVYKIIFNFPV